MFSSAQLRVVSSELHRAQFIRGQSELDSRVNSLGRRVESGYLSVYPYRGAPKERARGSPPPPLGLENTIFSGFLPLNYVICISEVCFLCFLLCERTEEACSMINSLRT